MKRWEVQTLCGNSWENCWAEDDRPMTFASEEEARDALAEHLFDVEQAVRDGHMREGFDPAEFRVVPCEQEVGG